MTAGTASPPGVITGSFAGAVTVVVLILAGCIGLLGILIVTSRVLRQWREHRRAALTALARPWLLELASGDDARVAGARSRVAALDRRHWKALEPTVVSLLAKVKGELRSSLVLLFDERGMTAHALQHLRFGGRFHQVRRARAAALLGSLGNQDAWAPLSAALEDRSLAVRIAAAKALGQIGMAGAARPLLEKLAASRRVPSDIVAYALIQLGPGAQGDLIQAVSHEEPLVRVVAVEILGRTGAVSAVQTLIAALQGDPSYGRVGLLALPYFVIFELFAPIVELAGIAFLVLGLTAGAINLGFAWLFLLVAYGYGLMLTMIAPTAEEMVFHRYRRWSDLGVALVASLAENFGYRQLTAVWRLQGSWAAIRRSRHGWGVMTRQGFTGGSKDGGRA